MPDLTQGMVIDTPNGRMLALPMETHPFLNHCIEITHKAGYMDKSGNFLQHVPKGAWGIWVKMYFEYANIEADWKYFEDKWGVRNLQQNMLKRYDPKYDLWKTIFKDMFS